MTQPEPIYIGRRWNVTHPSCQVVVRHGPWELPLAHVLMHSPAGFDWGHGGEGPADLALSILCHACGEAPTPEQLRIGSFGAAPMYQAFASRVVARFPVDRWEVSRSEILLWVAQWLDRSQARAVGRVVSLKPQRL